MHEREAERALAWANRLSDEGRTTIASLYGMMLHIRSTQVQEALRAYRLAAENLERATRSLNTRCALRGRINGD